MEHDHSRRRLLQVFAAAAGGAAIGGAVTASRDVAGDVLGWWPPEAACRVPRPAAMPRVRVPLHAPATLTGLENMVLTPTATWTECKLEAGRTYRLRSVTAGTSATRLGAGLIRFQSKDAPITSGLGLRVTWEYGAHIYLQTGPGLVRTDRLFTVNAPVRAYAVQSRRERDAPTVKTLSLEPADGASHKTDFFISFDVEAMPHRAPDNWIDALVWGKLGGKEHGLRRLCDILDDHRHKANFMVEFASCEREGDHKLKEIVEYLASRGHEIHPHLHSDVLLQSWGADQIYNFDTIPFDVARWALDHVVTKYEEVLGRPPTLFRAGGLRFNANMVLAAGVLGFHVLSDARDFAAADRDIRGDAPPGREPYFWENGLLEIPVDHNPDPLSSPFDKYLTRYQGIVARRNVEHVYNLLFHSWSLAAADKSGHFVTYEPEHERRLNEIFDHVSQHGTTHGYDAYVRDHEMPRATLRTDRIVLDPQPKLPGSGPPPYRTCNLCGLSLPRSGAVWEDCPGCGSAPWHRQLARVLDDHGNVFERRTVLAYRVSRIEEGTYFAAATRLEKLPAAGQGKLRFTAKDRSFDCFVGLHMLNELADDARAVADIARILKPGGVFVSTVPYQGSGSDGPADGRSYVLGDYLKLLSSKFSFSLLPGLDTVTGATAHVFIAYKR